MSSDYFLNRELSSERSGAPVVLEEYYTRGGSCVTVVLRTTGSVTWRAWAACLQRRCAPPGMHFDIVSHPHRSTTLGMLHEVTLLPREVDSVEALEKEASPAARWRRLLRALCRLLLLLVLFWLTRP